MSKRHCRDFCPPPRARPSPRPAATAAAHTCSLGALRSAITAGSIRPKPPAAQACIWRSSRPTTPQNLRR